MQEVYYVIANQNMEYFSYDNWTGGYPFFGKYVESAEHFCSEEKANEFLKNSQYTKMFSDTFKDCFVRKVTTIQNVETV